LPRGKVKPKICPVCDGWMSKNATTCMRCFRNGFGLPPARAGKTNPHLDTVLKKKLQINVAKFEKEFKEMNKR
jgi:hypothetical protein